MRYPLTALFFALAILPPGVACAVDSSTTEAVPTPFDADGYSVTANTSQENCRIGSTIDLKTMIAQVAYLQTRGFIPPDLNAARVDTQAWTTAATIAFKLQPLLVAIVFNSTPSLTHCEFLQTITGLDGKQQPAYGFDLTRDEFARNNWKSLGPGQLSQVTGHFRVFNESAAHLSDENK